MTTFWKRNTIPQHRPSDHQDLSSQRDGRLLSANLFAAVNPLVGSTRPLVVSQRTSSTFKQQRAKQSRTTLGNPPSTVCLTRLILLGDQASVSRNLASVFDRFASSIARTIASAGTRPTPSICITRLTRSSRLAIKSNFFLTLLRRNAT